MSRLLIAGALCLWASTAGWAAPSAAPARNDTRLEQAARAIDGARYAAADLLINTALGAGNLSEQDLDWAAYLKGRTLAGMGKCVEAVDAVRARQNSRPNGYMWVSLISLLALCERPAEAARAIVELPEDQLVMVNKLKPSLIEGLVDALQTGDSSLRDELISRLVLGRYTGPGAHQVPDELRLRFVHLLLRRGSIEHAARQTVFLESPLSLALLLTDRSFAPLWAKASVRQLLKPTAMIARVDRGIQAQLEQSHMSAEHWLSLMRTQRLLGRPRDAIRLGLHAIEQGRSVKLPASPALRLEIANAYVDVGEKWAAKRAAGELLKEQALLPLGLRISVAEMLENSGDDERALLLLGSLQGANGAASALRVTVCAAHDLGQFNRRDAALQKLEEQAELEPAELFSAYVCIGNFDEAVRVFGDLLSNENTRTGAILMAQFYSDHARAGSDVSDASIRMRAFVAREDVQLLLKPHARTIGLPFTSAPSRIR